MHFYRMLLFVMPFMFINNLRAMEDEFNDKMLRLGLFPDKLKKLTVRTSPLDGEVPDSFIECTFSSSHNILYVPFMPSDLEVDKLDFTFAHEIHHINSNHSLKKLLVNTALPLWCLWSNDIPSLIGKILISWGISSCYAKYREYSADTHAIQKIEDPQLLEHQALCFDKWDWVNKHRIYKPFKKICDKYPMLEEVLNPAYSRHPSSASRAHRVRCRIKQLAKNQ